MKIKLKIKYIIMVIFCVIFLISNNAYAAGSFSVSASKTSLNPGGTSTITVKTVNCAGKFKISSSNNSVLTISTSSTWIDGTTTITATAKANGTASITVTPVDVTDSDLNDVTGSKSVTINVTTPTSNANTNTSTNTNKNTNTKTSANTNKSTSNKTSTSTSKTTTKTTTKSNNAYLKSLIPSVEGLTPTFSKDIYSYSLKVGENVNSINIRASVEHSRASYTVMGNTNLKSGENKVTVKVTAEDGTVKNYVINVLKSDDPIKSDATLSSIIVEDAVLNPAFDANITEYDLGELELKSNKLNIYAYATNDNAKIKILGNENLKTGENKVTIKVTSENGSVTKEYMLSFNKIEKLEKNAMLISTNVKDSNKNKESLADKIKEVYNDIFKDKIPLIMLYFFVWFEFIQVVYLYEKLKKQEKGEVKSDSNEKEKKREIKD